MGGVTAPTFEELAKGTTEPATSSTEQAQPAPAVTEATPATTQPAEPAKES